MEKIRVQREQRAFGVRYRLGYEWADHYLADIATSRSQNTIRAYAFDLAAWLAYCRAQDLDPLKARPRDVLAFIEDQLSGDEAETAGTDSDGPGRVASTLSRRTLSRRLSGVRGWYQYLMLRPEETGVTRNPVPMGSAFRTAAGVKAQRPALLREDRPLPAILTTEEVARFLAHLTATQFRDRALVYLMWSAGLRISDALALRVGDIDWAQAMITVRSPKSRRVRRIPVGRDAMTMLSNYVRLERPKTLDHDVVFVCLGRRHHGGPMSYKAWTYVCDQARRRAGLGQIHAHLFRHTAATELAEGGMSLEALMKQLGHAHLDTVMVYTQVRNSRLAREFRQAIGEVSDETPSG